MTVTGLPSSSNWKATREHSRILQVGEGGNTHTKDEYEAKSDGKRGGMNE